MGEPVAKGGRYDRLLRQFGKDAPAIGFVIVIDDILEALAGQKAEIALPEGADILKYQTGNSSDYAEKLKQAKELRKSGKAVILTPET